MFISRGYRVPVMTLTAQTLLAELDTTLSEVSQDWRSGVLRQIADLFLGDAEHYSKDQVALFDAVIGLLLHGADELTLAELSSRLAGVPNAPAKVLASLANHPDLEVCGPVLERSKALPDKVLRTPGSASRIAALAERYLEELDSSVALFPPGPLRQLERPTHDMLFEIFVWHILFARQHMGADRDAGGVYRFRIAGDERMPPVEILALGEQHIGAGRR
jgi:hypothetical protein